ncbi:hypothetical protein H4S14_004363, partial [Agrobacterium vitis]|nr:hypothetical protein [Agrobacterium vitis]MBE1440579.1 hypothetical protein [Agrobacterium vitis]
AIIGMLVLAMPPRRNDWFTALLKNDIV